MTQSTRNKTVGSLRIERVFHPHRDAVFAALRAVPNLPDIPRSLKNQGERNCVEGPKDSDTCELIRVAMEALFERTYADAYPLDPEAIQRFCRVWAKVGRAILLRRKQWQ